MQTRVEFRSSKFPPYPGEELEVNPDLWGRRLAEYLQQKLAEHGIATGEIYPEDWGWVLPICNSIVPMWVGCGRYQEYEDGYLVFIEPSKPTIRKWLFKKIDTSPEVGRVRDVIDTLLRSDADIREIRWWPEEFD